MTPQFPVYDRDSDEEEHTAMQPHSAVGAFMAARCQLTAHVTLLRLPGLMTSRSKPYTVFAITRLLNHVVIIVLLGALPPQGRFMLSKLPHPAERWKTMSTGLKEVIQVVFSCSSLVFG